MKRFLLLSVAMLMVANVAVKAQTKIDIAGTRSKVEKLEATVQDPKKAEKSVNWMNLGKAYYDAATLPSVGFFVGQDEKSASLLFGTPTVSTETINGKEYSKHSYENIDAYFKDGVVVFWKTKNVIIDNALDKARDAYMKAIELDPKVAAKAREELIKVSDAFKQDGGNAFAADEYSRSAAAFAKSYSLLASPAVNTIDTSTAYNAGFLFTIGQDYEQGKKYLEEALKYKYEMKGDAYYYLFHAYYGLKDIDKAKETLQQGVSRFPLNSQLVESLLGIYAETGESPEAILPVVQEALKSDPNNAGLYVGLGLIYEKIGDMEKAIEALRTAVQKSPNDFYANYNLGILLTKKADNFANDLNNRTITGNAEYKAELAKLTQLYRDAIPVFEKAHEINSQNKVVVELLKNVYFRLRDEPGMMEKYEKYNALLESM